MSADLSTASLFTRHGLVLDENAMVVMETRSASSRLWRVPYDQVSSLAVSQQIPAARILVVTVLVLLPSLLLFLVQEVVTNYLGGVLAAVAIAVIIYYLIAKKTTLTFCYGHHVKTYPVIARPSRLNRFLQRFHTAVESAQDRRRAELT
ncbi:MAG: hypothetical protein AAF333_00775 [Planctomycetota bacterium]